MQINPLSGVRCLETFFWNSPRPAELLKTVKPLQTDRVVSDQRTRRTGATQEPYEEAWQA